MVAERALVLMGFGGGALGMMRLILSLCREKNGQPGYPLCHEEAGLMPSP